MTDITQVRLSGFGGQGIVMAGLLLGETGVIERRVVWGSNSKWGITLGRQIYG
jgi:hypothetical protein